MFQNSHSMKKKHFHKTENGYSLGNWVRSQRKKRDKLNSEQISRLDSLGFIWEVGS